MNNMTTADEGWKLVEEKLRSQGAKNIDHISIGKKKFVNVSNSDRTRVVRIYCKTRKAGSWQARTDDAEPLEEKANETNFWIFIDLLVEDSPQYYIVPEWWIKNDIYEVHQEFLKKHGGKRPKNPDAKHHSIKLERIEQWHDRWDLLKIL